MLNRLFDFMHLKYFQEHFFEYKIKELIEMITDDGIKVIYNIDDKDITKRCKLGAALYYTDSSIIEVASYYYSNELVKQNKISNEEIFYSICHEYGHAQSFRAGNFINELYQDYINMAETNIGTERILKEEARAWNFAEETAILYNAKTPFFDIHKNDRLKSYRNTIKEDNAESN